MPLDLGSISKRDARDSQLLFGWRASRLSLDAYTGQPGELRAQGSASDTAFTVTGRLGNTVTVGTTQPRWEQDPAKGTVTRLTLEGSVSGKVYQQLVFPFAEKVQPLTIFARCFPLYAAGASVAADGGPGGILVMIGNGPGAANGLILSRLSTTWTLRRIVPSATVDVVVTEPSAQVHPTDVLATLGPTGIMQVATRDAATPSVTRTGSASGTNAALCDVSQSWTLPQLTFGSALSAYLGGRYQYETVSVARGALTWAQMDALA